MASIEVTLALHPTLVYETLKLCVMCEIFTYFMQIIYDIIVVYYIVYAYKSVYAKSFPPYADWRIRLDYTSHFNQWDVKM